MPINMSDEGWKKTKFIHNIERLKTKKLHRAKCSVSGATYLVLRVTRVLGLAPVQFAERRDERLVCVSPALSVYTFILYSAIAGCGLAAIIKDFCLSPEKAVRVGPLTKPFLWAAEYFIVLLNMTISLLGSPWRMERVICCLDQIQKLDQEGNLAKTNYDVKRNSAFIVFYALVSVSLIVVDFFYFLSYVEAHGYDTQVGSMYVVYFISYLMVMNMEMQFVFMMLEAQAALEAVNDQLEEIGNSAKYQHKPGYNGSLSNNLVNVLSINHLVDTLTFENKSLASKTSRPLSGTLHKLLVQYQELHASLQHLVGCFALELMAVIAACLLHLVTAPYYMVMFLHGQKIHVHLILIQTAWCFWGLIRTVAVMEPGHKAKLETERTNWILSGLSLETTDSQIQEELEKFSAFLFLSKADYSAMGTCTLNRKLAVSIFGSVLTYIVIIFQMKYS